MSALPPGWCDTGLTGSYSLRAAMQIGMKQTRGMSIQGVYGSAGLSAGFSLFPPLRPNSITLNASLSVATGVFTSNDQNREVEYAGGSDPGVAGPLSQVYTYQETGGPYRIGAAYAADVDGGEFLPGNGNLERVNYAYALFEDEGTVFTYSFAGMTDTRNGIDSGTAIPLLWFSIAASSQADQTDAVEFIWSNLSNNGVAFDASALDDGVSLGTAGGQISVTSNLAFLRTAGATSHVSYLFAPGVRFLVDVDVLDYAGASLGARFRTNTTPVELTAPTQTLVSYPIASWYYPGSILPVDALDPARVWLSLSDTWLASKGLPAGQNNRIPIFGTPPRLSPWQPASYVAATVTVTPRLAVFKSANPWLATDAAKINVAGNRFEVNVAGSGVFRQMKENWRAWVGLGAGGKSNAQFAVDRYRVTKHDALSGAANAGQDVWSWASYGWAEIALDVAAPAGSLTLQVTGVQLSITDSHDTDSSQRVSDLTAVTVAFTKNYTFQVHNGSNTVSIDLLFPDEGGPFYFGRVDTIHLAGFALGAYTLTGFDLVTREDGYLKLDWDRRFMGVHQSQDGAGMMLNLPDGYQKADEVGDAGGALRLREPLYSGALQPGVGGKTLTDFLAEWNQIEGVVVAYNASASDAATKDSDGNKLNEVATMLSQQVPHLRLTPGAAADLTGAIRCGSIVFPNVAPAAGRDWLIYSRWRMGAALEAQTTNESGTARGAAGATVQAVRVSDGVVLASGQTDASGFVTLSPILADGATLVGLRSMP